MDHSLDAQQRQCVNHAEGSALVISGPGSGKTRIIVSRYIKSSQENKKPLCLTFANGANYQIINRVKQQNSELPINIYSFHGFAYKMLNLYNICNYNIIGEQQQSLLSHQLSIDIDIVNKYHCQGIGYNDRLAQMLSIYYSYCEENKVIDFSYLLFYFKNHLQKNKEFLSCLHRTYQEIIVDEFQDINYIQKEILLLLNQNNLFCVGDEDQAIYGWRGSNVDYMINFEKYFGFHTKYYLTNNYRSSGNIVKFANYIILFNKHRMRKTIKAIKHSGDLVQILNSTNEFDTIAKKISQILQDYPDKTISILVRKGSWINLLSHYFQQYGINYSTRINSNKKTFKIILSYMRFISNPNFFTLKQLSHVESIGVGQVTLNKLKEYDDNILEGLQNCKKHKLVTMYNITVNQEQKNRFKYIVSNSSSLRHKYSSQMIESLWKKWQQYGFSDNDLIEDCNICDDLPQILLTTIHKSKGLEFDTVFVVGLEEGEFPVGNCKDYEEERRIFYVACTRAVKELYITYGNFKNNPSRYISCLPGSITQFNVE